MGTGDVALNSDSSSSQYHKIFLTRYCSVGFLNWEVLRITKNKKVFQLQSGNLKPILHCLICLYGWKCYCFEYTFENLHYEKSGITIL